MPQLPLWRVPFLGGVPKKILDGVWSPVGWSPDGRQMAFIRLTARGSSVIVADAEGAHKRVVSSRRSPSRFYAVVSSVDRTAPAWSPDGRRIAVRGTEPDSQESPVEQVVVIDAVTGSAQAIPLPRRGSGGVAWLDDASLVATIEGQLWRVSLPQGQLSRITNDLLQYRHLSLRRIAARWSRLGPIAGRRCGSEMREVRRHRRRRAGPGLATPCRPENDCFIRTGAASGLSRRAPVRGRSSYVVAPDPRRTLTVR